MNRYAILVITFVAQMCLGCSYAWSMFVASFKAKYGIDTAYAQLGFGVMLATFAFLTPFTGKLQDRFGPRKVATIGAIIFGAGFYLGGTWANDFWKFLFTLGVMSGLGLGSVYPCILATCVKWFPNRKGLVSGLAVAGYGLGAMVLTWLSDAMLNKGVPMALQNFLATFGATFSDKGTVPVNVYLTYLGLVMGVIVLAGALSLSLPESSRGAKGAAAAAAAGGIPWSDIRLWGMFLAFLCGTFAGLMAIGNIKQIGEWKGVLAAAATGGILFNLANAIGRVTWGGLSDKLGGRQSMIAGLVLQGIAMGVMTLVPGHIAGNAWPFYLLAICYGFLYANNFALYPAECARIWGPARLGAVYGVVFFAFGIAGLLGPYTGGKILEMTKSAAMPKGSYTYALWIAAVACWLGAIIIATMVKPRPAPQLAAVAEAAGAKK